jgi:adenylylsulfate kinase
LITYLRVDTDIQLVMPPTMDKRITLAERETINKHKALAVWLTGLPASGKSTLAFLLEAELTRRRYHCYVLDGDDLRRGLNCDLAFSPLARAENIRRAGQVARLMFDAGLVAITSFISPYRSDRDRARKLFPPLRFVEVYLECPLQICESRDPKGMYSKARRGEIPEFTGISAPYEPPEAADLLIPTGEWEIGRCVEALVGFCLERISRIREEALAPAPSEADVHKVCD